MCSNIFIKIFFSIFILVIFVQGEKPKIIGYDKNNNMIPINDPEEIKN